MSFLNKNILLAILQIYYQSTENRKSKFLALLLYGKDVGSKFLNKNTQEISKAACRKLRVMIEEAFEKKDPALFAELIWVIGECGHHTRVTSSQEEGSEFSKVAFALRSYILYKIEKTVASIAPDRYIDPDQAFAQEIKKAINKRIEENQEYINSINKLKTSATKLMFSIPLPNNTTFNAFFTNKLNDYIAENIKIAQRQLYYLGDTSQTDLKKVIPNGLFPEDKYTCYNSRDKLDHLSESKILYGLPLELQPDLIYVVIFLRSKVHGLKEQTTDTAVISSYEQIVEINLKEEAEGNKTLLQSRQHKSGEFNGGLEEPPPEFIAQVRSSPVIKEETNYYNYSTTYTGSLSPMDNLQQDELEEAKQSYSPKKENSSTQIAFEAFNVPILSPEAEKVSEIKLQEENIKTPLALAPAVPETTEKRKNRKGKKF